MELKETVQISATIEKDLHASVKEEAQRDNRSFSVMVGILLGNALKERERQRAKHKKKTNEV